MLLRASDLCYERLALHIDFHRHLEGSHTARALLAVATQCDLRDPLFWTGERWRTEAELAPLLHMQGPPGDGAAFYAAIETGRRAYVSSEAVARLAYESFVDAAAEADAIDMRVSLFSMTRTLLGKAWRDATPAAFAEKAREVLLGLIGARDRAQRETGTRFLLRIGLSRTFESAPHYRALGEVLADHASALCGLDVLGILMSGDKEPLQPELVAIMQRLRPLLPDLTIHAGEFEDHRSVERALELAPQAIGHGIHALGSEETLARLRREGVTLEVCPSSNDLLIPGAVAKMRALHVGAHPVRALQEAHVHTVLGSDDPVCMGTTFSSERRIANERGMDDTQLAADVARRWRELGG